MNAEEFEIAVKNMDISVMILGLSSGTIASATGIKEYWRIDKIQNAFSDYVRTSKEPFKTWVDAWNYWWPTVEQQYKEDKDGNRDQGS